MPNESEAKYMRPAPEPGWDRVETLRWDGDLVLSRGIAAPGSDRILVLAAASEQPSPRSIERLRHEYSLRDQLDPAWAAKPRALVGEHGRTMLLLDDPGGELLHRLLGQPWQVMQFVRVAIGIAASLGRVHERGLIHKDVKPANILVNIKTSAAWLTGFAIASRLPREHQIPEAPEVIAGTLAYMAPEQTGRMNRSVDSRSDLYALGVTFYELLTGALPFSTSDPMEWIHCHIARQPVPPRERMAGVPGQLSEIVMKLLAKTAEERYQTAAGIEADLRRCLAEWEASGRIEPFPLGAHDAPKRLLIPEKLYGREREIEALLAAFERVVANGTPELALVSGYSGIGKSSVVNELHKVLVPPRGLFASGKFDQYKRDIPYATLAQAFQSLVRPLLGKNEVELDRWRDALREALGANGQLMVNLVPELELVIGTQSPVPDLPPQDAKNRFQMVFRRFLGAFASKEHPLALFLDDLQWLDSATLEVLEHLLTHPDVRHVFLVGVYRDNEVGPAHALTRTLETIREAGAKVHEIVLAPLRLDDVAQLIADALHSEPQRARALAQLVHEKTNGNPFFTIQFFTALVEEGLLAFDPVAPGWQWDINRIRAKSYTDNVVELMAGKLKRLSATTQEALKLLACLGNLAEVATLAMVRGETNEAVHTALWEAARSGLVLYQDSAYKFLHDRIQQAAYSLIPEEQRGEMHLRIGRALLQSLTAEQLAEHLFDVANQLNRGAAVLIDRAEKAQVAMIELRAGRKAKASAACASACVYLATGMALLDESGWSRQYELTFNLWLERAECEFLAGNFDQAEQLIAVLLLRAASKVDQAAVYHVKIRLHVVKSEYPQAVDSALTCLRLLGIDLPVHPTWEQVEAEYDTVWRNLEGRTIEDLIDLSLMTDPELQAVMGLLSALRDAVFFANLHLYCLLTCRMVNVSIRHGISSASTQGLANFGVILGAEFHRHREGYRFARLACDLVEKHNFNAYQARVHNTMGMVAPWTQPIATALDFTRSAFRAATEAGDLTYICFSQSQTVSTLLLRNDPLDAVWRESETGLDLARKAGFRYVYDLIVSQQRFIASMQGRTASLSSFSDAQFDEAAFEAQLPDERTPPMIFRYWVLKLKARFLAGEYVDALAAADRAKALFRASPAHFQLLDYFYYIALTVAALYEGGSADDRNRWLDLLKAHREQLREWADNNPANFFDKYALVLAEIARVEGRGDDAMRLYEESIQSARDNGFVQNEGLAHEVAARFYAARGVDSVAHTYLWNARHCYLRWGALGKVRQLDQQYPRLAKASAPSLPAATIGSPVEQFDVGAVVAASQAVSGEIVLERLIETLMTLALQHAGAERGLLILLRGDTPQIEAEAITDRQTVEVALRQEIAASAHLPESLLHTVIRTQGIVLLDDALAENPFAGDVYIRRKHPRSVLCLPLVKQAKLIGVLYLENRLVSHVFTPARCSVLNLLSSQAAISLQNAQLYTELREENSERTRAEEALRQSEERFALAMAGSKEGIFDWDLVQDRVYISHRAQQLLGLSPGELSRTRREWRAVLAVHPDDVNLQRHGIKAHLAGEAPTYDVEFRLVLPDGNSRWFHQRGIALRDEAGKAYRMVGSIGDITDRKVAQEELLRLERRLRQAQRLEALGTLAGGIAHDFNNILGAVLGFGQRALRDATRGSRLYRDLDSIVSAGERGRALVERILAFSSSSVGERVAVHMETVVREALDLITAKLPAGVQVEADLRAGRAATRGDSTQIHQVLTNLATNAVHAMPSGGTLHVALELLHVEEARLATVGSLAGGDYIVLTVSDTGTGMAPEVQERIFDPFFTTKDIGIGTGLGLSLVHSIIADMEGAIDVATKRGEGSVFTVYLRRSGDVDASRSAEAPAPPRGGRQRVLVVDDEEPLVRLATETLEELGYVPLGFTSSAAALAAFRADPQRFDAVITDERMPGMSGSALIREMRDIRESIPIILMSGFVGGDLLSRVRESGAQDVLKKPLSAHDLATSLARVLRA